MVCDSLTLACFRFFYLFIDRYVVAEMIEIHVKKCKEIPFLRYALPIIIPESNLVTMAAELQRTLKLNLQMKCQFMTEDKRKHSMETELPGNVTTHQNKIEMISILINTYLKPGKICLYHNFVVTVSEGEEATQVVDVKKELIRQMRDFAKIKRIKTAGDGSQIATFVYNGKTKGANDDLVMAILMAGLMCKWFNTLPKYQGIRNAALHL